VRLPAVSWLRELVREAGIPLTATSANISGEKEISRPEKIKDIFWEKVDLIVDGGKTPGTQPSTVLDLTSEKPKILREGIIPITKIRKYLSV
jgi:L-threonylcarbamoyladenylate synthase